MIDPAAYSTDTLCAGILSRHRDTIAVKKPAFAVRKLSKIVSAALDLSNQKGFQAMTLRELSEASGVSMGGLYAYFDTKTTLLKMILTEVTEQVRSALSTAPQDIRADPARHLDWLIDTHVRLTETMLPWFTFAFMEAKNFPPAERRMATDSEELTESFFAETIARGVADGTFRSDTSPLLASLIKPLLQDWYVKRSKYRRRGVDIAAYVQTIQQIVNGACAPPEGDGPGQPIVPSIRG
ncbi:TetR/AcrR family transcriptional regulator [Sulfitobacter dubius]|uniref:TetR/AcrR family transcriptional regulator n=1 Tax=Sulfitobacter dubius TaxID=218673 RepID=UPI0022AEE6C0|nr:TetR/AcrR family transcriptional regulator [Sulfitobacter dubius]MCZ4366281.1 TetR/AcrR family transcriptional regulator [Sulfitobacter dubius]